MSIKSSNYIYANDLDKIINSVDVSEDSGAEVDVSTNVTSTHYKVTDVAPSGNDSTWINNQSTYNDVTYSYYNKNTSGSNSDRLFKSLSVSGVHANTHQIDGSGDERAFAIYSNSDGVSQNASNVAIASGGFTGTVEFKIQFQAVGSSHNGKCDVLKYNSASGWTKIWGTGWVHNIETSTHGDDTTITYSYEEHSFSESFDPSTIIIVTSYRSNTDYTTMDDGSREDVHNYGSRTCHLYCNYINTYKTCINNCINLTNGDSVISIPFTYQPQSNHLITGELDSNDYIHYSLGSDVISNTFTALNTALSNGGYSTVSTYNNSVSNGIFTVNSSVNASFGSLFLNNSHIDIGSSGEFSFGLYDYVYTPNNFYISFRTDVKEGGLNTKNIFAKNMIGIITRMIIPNPPAGWKICNGGVLEKSSYPLFWEVISTNLSGRNTDDTTIQSLSDSDIWWSENYVKLPNITNENTTVYGYWYIYVGE